MPDEGDAPPLLARGEQVDHFEVLRLLGRGGMGEVHLARDLVLGRKVALKLVRSDFAASEGAVERFLDEARTTARLSHPNVVTIHAVGQHEGIPYVALEYVRGEDLAERYRRHRPALQETLRVMVEIAEGVEAAHAEGILHLDLKPENVVVGSDGRARVVDFGLSRRIAIEGDRLSEPPPSGVAPSADDPATTQEPDENSRESVRRAGTPSYMAPEQWLGLEHSRATDVWAIGVIMFELVAGRLPFEDADLPALSQAVCDPDRQAPRLDELAGIPEPVADLVSECLQKLPDDRPSTGEIATRLRSLIRTGSPLQGEASPFRGLFPFTERHAGLFFGRQEEIASFVERARELAVLPVVGASGAGKSSFVQAGVISRLRERGPLLVLTLRPGEQPFEAVAARLIRRETTSLPPAKASALRTTMGQREHMVEFTAAKLRAHPRRLGVELRKIARAERKRVLLFVDQLEELFTLVPDESHRRAFMEAICTAADDPDDPIRVIFTLRDDFLGRVAVSPIVRDVIAHVTVIQPLDAEALRETLTKPLEMVGYRFEDEEMVDEMVAAVAGEPAGLPMVQFAAEALWQRRDSENKVLRRRVHDEMGGVEGALARHADEVLAGLSPTELSVARQLLLRLVTPERTRRVLSTDAALEGLDETGEEVLDRLTRARLVSVTRTRDARGPGAILELAHESLVHSWDQLARWLDEAREEHVFLTEAGQAAELWAKRGHRDDELWRDDALTDALRTIERQAIVLPQRIEAFVAASRERQARHRRRRRRLLLVGIGALATIAAAAVIVAGVVVEKEKQAQRARAEAEDRRREAEAERAEALRESARAAWAQQSPLEARAKLRAALELDDSTAARALWWQLDKEPRWWRMTATSRPYSLALSPDDDEMAMPLHDGSLLLVALADRSTQRYRGHRASPLSVTYSPDGKWIASGDAEGEVLIWSRAEGRPVARVEAHQAMVLDLRFSPTSDELVTASEDKTVKRWSVPSGTPNGTLEGAEAGLWGVDYVAGGRVVAGGADATIRFWSSTGALTRSVTSVGIRSLRASPDGQRIAVGGLDGKLRLYDVAEARLLRVFEGHDATVRSIAFDGQGEQIAAGAQDGRVVIWKTKDGKVLHRIDEHDQQVRGVGLTTDGEHLATAGYGRQVRLWDVARLAREAAAAVPEQVEVIERGAEETLLAAGADAQLWRFDLDTGAVQLATKLEEGTTVSDMALSPDGATLAIGTHKGLVMLYDEPELSPRDELEGHEARVFSLDFAPDGRSLATASIDGTARTWNLASGDTERIHPDDQGGLRQAQFSPDGRVLATSGADGTIHLHGEAGPPQILNGHEAEILGLDHSPDGQRLASGDVQGRVMLWNREAKTSRELIDLGTRINDLRFFPDGTSLAIATADGLELVDLDGTRRHIADRRGWTTSVLFPDEGKIATTGPDGAIRLWNTNGRPAWHSPGLYGEPLRLACHRGWHHPVTGEPTEAPAGGASEAVASTARLVRRAPGGSVCILGFDDEVALWPVGAKEPAGRIRAPEVTAMEAVDDGCVWLAAGEAFIWQGRDRKRIETDAPVRGLGRDHADVLLVTDEAVSSTGEASTKTAWSSPGKITALRAHDDLFVAYEDGGIERLAADGTRSTMRLTPSARPTRMLAGPRDTLVVGYGNGEIGMWSIADGTLLARERLRGPVVDIASVRRHLVGVSELGDRLAWDLEDLHRDHCELLRDVWARVPVGWQAGRAEPRPPPTDHRCSP